MATFSLSGFFYLLLLKVRGKEIITCGSCRACGRCCRRISLHDGHQWLRRKEDFVRLLEVQPEYGRFSIVETDKQGFLVFSCSLITPSGLCGDYENRLPLCRNFPEKSLPFCGGSLPSGCGYSFREVTPFAKVLQKELLQQHKE